MNYAPGAGSIAWPIDQQHLITWFTLLVHTRTANYNLGQLHTANSPPRYIKCTIPHHTTLDTLKLYFFRILFHLWNKISLNQTLFFQMINWKLDHEGMNPSAESYLVLHRFGSVSFRRFHDRFMHCVNELRNSMHHVTWGFYKDSFGDGKESSMKFCLYCIE